MTGENEEQEKVAGLIDYNFDRYAFWSWARDAARRVLASKWLADRDRNTAANAWDACLDAIEQNELNTGQAREGNPYREEAA